MSDLNNLRKQLDELDEELVHLVAKRMDLIRDLSQVKATKTGGIKDSAREREVMAHVEKIARSHNISSVFAKKLFREIIDYSLSEQTRRFSQKKSKSKARRIVVAYQGIENSNSYLTAQAYFAPEYEEVAFIGNKTFKQAVQTVLTSSADFAFLPIENTIAGSINQVYNLLLENDLVIVGEEICKVEHCLIGAADVPVEEIRKIYSHPQAIEQCSNFLAQLRGTEIESYFDTAGAVKKIADEGEPTQAAIGPVESAEAWGLHVLARNIADQEKNYTRFVVLAKKGISVDVRIPCKTSLILSTRHEQGALAKCLSVLSKYHLSMTKLESRPRMNRPWEYLFYLDFEGNITDPQVARALDELRAEALYLKVLGSYPAKVLPAESALIPAQVTETAAEEEPQVELKEEKRSAPAVHKSKNYRLVSRDYRPQDTSIRVGDLLIGGSGFVVMAGPCSVETEEQINETARHVKEHGAHVLRGGVFKPRTSPYSFQGLGWDGLRLLYEAGKKYGLPIVTEVLAPEQVKGVAEKADILQIGARNMQNFPLLLEVGKVNRPVLLKRGLMSTLEELLAAAEYIVAQGNGQVILCERGIRTFETATRNTLDLSAVPALAERTHLPVIVDPSHGTGKRSYVAPMSLAARAVGAHGLLIEVHPNPDQALSDGDQSITLADFSELMNRLKS